MFDEETNLNSHVENEDEHAEDIVVTFYFLAEQYKSSTIHGVMTGF